MFTEGTTKVVRDSEVFEITRFEISRVYCIVIIVHMHYYTRRSFPDQLIDSNQHMGNLLPSGSPKLLYPFLRISLHLYQ